MMPIKAFHFALISTSIIFVNTTFANNMNSVIAHEVNGPELIKAYWTPERMRDAEPMELPRTDPKNVKKISISKMKSQFGGTRTGEDGAPPSIEIQPDMHQYFQPMIHKELQHKEVASFDAIDTGTVQEQFTSAQLTPTTSVTVYPYRAAGKLFFTTPNGNKTCSASVIKQRIVLTAGHCVHSGNNSSTGWYTNFMFVPAFNNGAAPFLTWSVSYKATTNIWYNSAGKVPNAADWGMLEIIDQPVNGVSTRIGNLVGWLGWQSLSTIPNHATILGYPNAFDNGQLMHQVLAQSATEVAPNNAEYGSDMSFGAGGGPWIQNFGSASTGQTGGLNPGRNRVIGVTSYGFNNTTSLANGSSILDNNFVGLLNFVCNHKSGNCQ